MKAGGTCWIYLLESRRNFFEIYGNKGFAFVNSLPPAMRGAPGRDRLRPQTPPRRVPRPRSINHSSQLHPDKTCTARLRADPLRQPKHAKKALRSFFRFAREPRKQRSKRAYGVVARTDSKRINRTVAHIKRFRPTCRPNDESENRPGGSHIVWVQPEQTFDRIVRTARNP